MSYAERRPVPLNPAIAPPVRLTTHESRVWYRLSVSLQHPVSGADLLFAGWGAGYSWDYRDPNTLHYTNRAVVQHIIYMLRRLLEAQGGYYAIQTVRTAQGVAYQLRRDS